MPKVTFTIGDVNDELSLAYARTKGFQIRLRGVDGDASIQAPGDGRGCTLYAFQCSCADSRLLGGSFGGYCIHAVWAAQLYPCDACGGTMHLTDQETPFGKVQALYSCPDCGNAREFGLVREERRRIGLGWPRAGARSRFSRKVTV